MDDPKVPDRAKIARNLDRMAQANASEQEMEEYLASEGLSAAPAAPARTATPGQQFGALVGRGATLGFAPKILGAIDAIDGALPAYDLPIIGKGGGGKGSFGERYTATRDRVRDAAEEGIREHPVAGRAAEFFGGALSAIPAGAASAGRAVLVEAAKRRSMALAAARAGALTGAVAGAGDATGGVQDYAQKTLTGGVVGGLTGGAVGAAGGAIGGRLARRAAVREGYSAVAPTSAEASGAVTTRQQRLGDLRTYEGFARDGVTPTRLRTEGEIVARTGRPDGRIVADMGGQNTLGMARAARAVGGEGKEKLGTALLRRQKAQLPSIMAAVKKGAGVGDGDLFDTVDDLVLQADKEASPFYEKAYAHGAVADPVVAAKADKLIRLVPGAHEAALRLADAQDVPLTDLLQTVGKGQRATHVRTVKYYDFLKRAIDEQLKGEVGRGIVGQTKAGILATKNEMLAALDNAVPDFGTARAKFAGPMGVKDAAEAGREFLKRDPREVTRALADMNDAERNGFRLGGTDALRQFMEKVSDTGDLARKIIGNPAIRAKIRTLFPDTPEGKAGYVTYLREAANQARQARTKSGIMDGSQTADKLAEIADMTGVSLGELAMESGKALATGGMSAKASLVRGMGNYLARQSNGVRGNVADAISRNMLVRATDQPGFQNFVGRMEAQEAGHAAKQLVGQTAGRVVGAGTAEVTAPHSGVVHDRDIDAAIAAGLTDPKEIRAFILQQRTP